MKKVNTATKWFLLLGMILLQSDMMAIGFTIPDINLCLKVNYSFKDTSSAPTGLTITNRNWNFGDGTSINTVGSTATHTYSTIGSYTVTMVLTYSDKSTVAYSYPSPVSIKTPPSAGFGVNLPITCPGVPIIFTANNTKGDGTMTSFVMDFGDGFSTSPMDVMTNYQYKSLGQFDVVYTVTDQYQCTSVATQKITIISHPKVSFAPLNLSCKDSTVYYENRTSNKNTFTSWTWTFIDSSKFIVNRSGVNEFFTWSMRDTQYVYLQGKNIYQCVGIDSLMVKVDTTPILVITPSIDTIICYGQSIQYKTLGSDTLFYNNLIWATKVSGDSVINVTPKNTFTYTVYGKTPNCPARGTDIKVSVVQPITTKVDVLPPIILKGNQAKIILRTNGVIDSLRWKPSSTIVCATCDSTGASPITSTWYKINVYSSLRNYSCLTVDSGYLEVSQMCDVDSLKIPNAFTPNGDNLNDVFFLKSYSIKKIESFNIYNRWGDRVFYIANCAPNDQAFGWNGKMNNVDDEMPPGTYVYNIQAVCANDQVLNFQGEVTLIR